MIWRWQDACLCEQTHPHPFLPLTDGRSSPVAKIKLNHHLPPSPCPPPLQVFSGLLEEAASLLLQGIPAGSSTASRAIGYRQAMQLLQSKAGAAMQAEAEAAGTAADAQKSGEASAGIQPAGSNAADADSEDATTTRAPSAIIATAPLLPAEAGVTAAVVTAQELDNLVREIITATHKLVRSQMTWFRWGQPGGGFMGSELDRDAPSESACLQ